jgi:hypothetical protein
MIPRVGEGWVNGAATGDPVFLSWHEASARFGRGREIEAPRYAILWATDTKVPLIHAETYVSYRLGTTRYDFAGCNDWRLATVEELFSLIVTNAIDPLSWYVWAANASDLSPSGGLRPVPGLIGKLLNAEYQWCAWHAEADALFGDGTADGACGMRLVRRGYVYQAVEQQAAPSRPPPSPEDVWRW